jgi:acetolactate synthase small subunit
MTRRFSLLVDDRPETLLRVTGLCLRRRADVLALHYGRSRHPGWARLDLELAVDERHSRGLDDRLRALVEVRDLAELHA